MLSREGLLRHGILYPTPVRANNHASVTSHFFGSDVAPFPNKLLNNFNPNAILAEGQATWDTIEKELLNHDVDTAILSAEILFGMGRRDAFDAFIETLRSFADELHVVAYVRSPAEHFLSMKQQSLKHALPRRVPKEDADNRIMLGSYLDTEGIILHVHPFDRDRMHDGDIVTDFFTRHLSAAARDAIVRPDADENTSLSPEAMVILDELRTGTAPRKYAHYGRPSADYADLIQRLDGEIPRKTRPKYKPGIAQKIFDAKQDLDWLDATFGIRFERPAGDPAADNLTLDDLKTVRSLCYVNEDRYQQFWQILPPPEKARLRWIGRKLRNAFKHPLRAISNISKLLSRLVDRRPTKT